MTGETLSLEGMASNLDSDYGRVVDSKQTSRCAELSWLMHSHGDLPRPDVLPCSCCCCRGTVAQLVEHPVSFKRSRALCNSTDVGLKHATAQGGSKNPSSAICCGRYNSAVWEDVAKKMFLLLR